MNSCQFVLISQDSCSLVLVARSCFVIWRGVQRIEHIRRKRARTDFARSPSVCEHLPGHAEHRPQGAEQISLGQSDAARAASDASGGESTNAQSPERAEQASSVSCFALSGLVRSEAVKKLGQAPSRPLIFWGFRPFGSEPVPFLHSLSGARVPRATFAGSPASLCPGLACSAPLGQRTALHACSG
jgi:hypothetical protein